MSDFFFFYDYRPGVIVQVCFLWQRNIEKMLDGVNWDPENEDFAPIYEEYLTKTEKHNFYRNHPKQRRGDLWDGIRGLKKALKGQLKRKDVTKSLWGMVLRDCEKYGFPIHGGDQVSLDPFSKVFMGRVGKLVERFFVLLFTTAVRWMTSLSIRYANRLTVKSEITECQNLYLTVIFGNTLKS